MKPILKNNVLIFTVKGLEEMVTVLMSREANYFRNRKVKRPPLPYDHLLPKKFNKPLIEIAREEVEKDAIKDAKIMTYAMNEYLKDLEEYERKQLSKAEPAEESQPA